MLQAGRRAANVPIEERSGESHEAETHPTRGKQRQPTAKQVARGRNPRTLPSPQEGLPRGWQKLVPGDLRLQHALSLNSTRSASSGATASSQCVPINQHCGRITHPSGSAIRRGGKRAALPVYAVRQGRYGSSATHRPSSAEASGGKGEPHLVVSPRCWSRGGPRAQMPRRPRY